MAFQQGLSGLNTSSRALDVVSNNIANAATVGFKAGQAQFADVYAASLGIGGASQVGIGASVPVVQQQFTQGNISNSNNPLDLAVNGNGFFRLEKTDGTISYTRNGQFHSDADGFVVTQQLNHLTGFPINQGVTDRTLPQNVQLRTTGFPPQATGAAATNPGIATKINLDDRDTKSLKSGTIVAWENNTSFPPNNLNTFNYSTSITAYDQKGNDHALSMYFSRAGNSDDTTEAKNLWQVHYVLDDQDITQYVTSGGATGGIPTLRFTDAGQLVSGATSVGTIAIADEIQAADTTNGTTLNFRPDTTLGTVIITNSTGTVTYVEDDGFNNGDYTVTATGISFNPASTVNANSPIPNGASLKISYNTGSGAFAANSNFSINVAALTDPTTGIAKFTGLFPADIPLDYANSTLFGSGYDVNKLTQDGYPYGRLSSVSVSPEGILRGSYTNGQTDDIYQLVLVDFISPTGLVNLGNNQWGETAASGSPLVGDPGAGNRGVLQAAAVEDANVDLTQELVNLITFQRNYQANAQSIKTQDQIMQTLVNLR